ncbi:MAG: YqgE/AlgH family protein [Bacteroidetes bacterium]|nr:YqgE/AlgH family protein [Bacteroidota bacterium]
MEKINNRNIGEKDVKFFIGYSGWGPSQLNEEFALDSWIKANATAEDIFDTKPELLWQKILKNKGTKYAILSNSPLDPSWN